MNAHILIVEDDLELAGLVQEYLERHEFEVSLQARGDTAITTVEELLPDAIVLDLMLPGMDGLTVCRTLRSRGFSKPILMLTARGGEHDEIIGLETGADDYMAKPVRPRLLLTRLRALLRRSPSVSDSDETAPQPDQSVLEVGGLSVNLPRREVSLRGERVHLTTAEFDLLSMLAQHAGKICTRDDLYIQLRGIEYDGLDRTMDLRVSRLRNKLGDTGRTPKRIKSIRGVGYVLVDLP